MPGLLDRLQLLEPEQRRYTLETLAAFLRDAEQFERLAVLFSDDAWMRARHAGSGGVYDGFLADLAVVWDDVALPEARLEIEAAAPRALADCVRYALIAASVPSVAGNLPPPLVEKALRAGLWDPARVLGAAAGAADDEQQLELHCVALASGRLDQARHARAQRTALEVALSAASEKDRAERLALLAPHLAGESLERALAAAHGIEAVTPRVKALAALAGAFDGDERAGALGLALRSVRSIEASEERANALVSLLPHLEGEERAGALTDAVQAAQRVRGLPGDRMKSLAAIAACLEGSERREMAEKALDAALVLDGQDLAYQLQYLIPVLDPSQRERLVTQTFPRVIKMPDFAGDNDTPRPIALIALGPLLRGDDLVRARSTVLDLPRNGYPLRPKALAAVARALRGEKRAELLREALSNARSEDFGPYRVSSLAEVAELLEGRARSAAVREALEVALGLWDEQSQPGQPSPRLKALGELAPLLEGELLERALGAAGEIKDYTAQAWALVTLARSLAGDDRAAAMRAGFDALWRIKDDQLGIFTIEKVLPLLDGPVLATALEAAMALPLTGNGTSHRADALKALAPQLSGDLIGRAYAAAVELERPYDRAETLAAVAGRLTGAPRFEAARLALDAIPQIESAQHFRAIAVRDLAQHLEGELVAQAWELLLSLDSRASEYVTSALIALAPRLEGDLLGKGVRTLASLPNHDDRVRALAALLPKLKGRQRDKALAKATKTTLAMGGYYGHPERAAVLLAPYLKGANRRAVLKKGLKAALDIGNPQTGADALIALAGHLNPDEKSLALREAFSRTLRVKDGTRRAELLDAILSDLDAGSGASFLDLARSVDDASDRAQILASFAKCSPSSWGLVAEVRALLLQQLSELKGTPRKAMLELVAHPAMFAPPVFPSELVRRVAAAVEEVSHEWTWL